MILREMAMLFPIHSFIGSLLTNVVGPHPF